jgi:transcriptional regulator with XRE-family HTH domain
MGANVETSGAVLVADSTRDMIPGFGAAVRKRREDAALSLEALAERVGTHFTAISKIERSQRAPSLSLAVRIAGALGVTVDVLLQDAARLAEPDRPKRKRN